jgi:hypothetical protein
MSFRINNSFGSAALWSVVSIVLFASALGLYLQAPDTYINLAQEDSIIENLSFLFYLVAGSILLLTGIRSKDRESRGILIILLGAFFVFVAGEEISWGQRFLNVATPTVFQEHNTQSELNVHNLAIFDKNEGTFNQHTLLNVFVLLNGVVFPILFLVSKSFKSLVLKIRFPIIPLACVPVFAIGLLFGQTVPKIWPHWSHTEYKELFYALGFVLFAFSIRAGLNRQQVQFPFHRGAD